ncbi:MAG: hypothetical protein KBD94_06065, partial [Pyrinomonadaceae bacterium]|nr:hypothetical protein [Pyrinomonadaceae bacterium]
MSGIFFRSKVSASRLFRFTGIAALLTVLAFMASASPPVVQWFQGFEVDNVWHSSPALDPVRVPSGTGGVTSKTGAFHAEVALGNATNWGGYNSVFPTNGYTTSVDIYLDMAGGWANDKRFDWSSAINNPGGTHRRDFIFNGGYYTDGTAPGSGPRFVFSASNTTLGWPKDPARGPVAVNVTGWYTMRHTFLPGPGGVLIVKLELIAPSGVVAGTWSLSDPTDIIGGTV